VGKMVLNDITQKQKTNFNRRDRFVRSLPRMGLGRSARKFKERLGIDIGLERPQVQSDSRGRIAVAFKFGERE
jgi:hypothetical protein